MTNFFYLFFNESSDKKSFIPLLYIIMHIVIDERITFFVIRESKSDLFISFLLELIFPFVLGHIRKPAEILNFLNKLFNYYCSSI